ncbi:unnamed protein product [Rhizophagus irregularis]|nr:unnamed protein product [Rhizophagus irregularis]
MEVDWKSYINFPEDIIPINFFSESVEGTELENIIPPNNFLEEPIEPPINSPIKPFIESLIEPLTEPQSPCTDNLNTTNYQYKHCVGDNFDDWLSVDTFMHKYCQERGFGYQIFRNDKDQNDRSISRRKSFRCSLSGTYEAQHQIRCTTLVDVHNHELVSSMQIAHLNAIYRQFNEDMMQDLKFFTDCKVTPIVQLEILKKKYPQHVFHRQDVYNSIYKLRESGKNDKKLNSDLYQQFHDMVLSDNTCKTNKYNMYLSVFMIKDNYGKFRNIANVLVEDEMASTYTWILQCIMKATDNVAPKSFWTDAEPGLINALGSKFHSFSTYFYSCRNTLSTELFEKKWKSMLDTFPECYSYMMRALYPNRSSWAKSYLPFQFNAGIQSTQSVKSFNALIKKSLNSASTLCDIEKAINRRHEDEFQYCKLVDLKAQQTTVGLPHLSLQFFSKIDAVLTQFLTPLILSWQRFQISQSFTYEGCLTQSVIDDEILNVQLLKCGEFAELVEFHAKKI